MKGNSSCGYPLLLLVELYRTHKRDEHRGVTQRQRLFTDPRAATSLPGISDPGNTAVSGK